MTEFYPTVLFHFILSVYWKKWNKYYGTKFCHIKNRTAAYSKSCKTKRVIHLHINIYIFTYLHSLHIILSIFLMVIAIFLQWAIMCNSDSYTMLSPLVETDWRGKKYFENQNDRSCWSLSLDIKDASLLF